jgi:hypothetical protein
MAKSNKAQEIAKFRQNKLTVLKLYEAELRESIDQLQQLASTSSLTTNELLADCGSNVTFAKTLLENSSATMRNLCEDLDKYNVQAIWQLLKEYFDCGLRIRELGQLALTLEQQQKGTKGIFCPINIDSFNQVVAKLRYATMLSTDEPTPIAMDTLFADAQVIPKATPVSPSKTIKTSRNPLYKLMAKVSMAIINTKAVKAAQLEDQLVKANFNGFDRITFLKQSMGEKSLYYVQHIAEQASSKWIIPVTGAGGHPFYWLQDVAEIADLAGVNYLAVDHVVNFATNFIEPQARLEAAVKYLTEVKKIRLEDIAFVTHSNGGTHALHVAKEFNLDRNELGLGCKVVLDQAYTSLADTVANQTGKLISSSKPSRHKRQISVADSATVAAVKGFAKKQFAKAYAPYDAGHTAEDLKQQVGVANVASVYMGVKTERNARGQKYTKPRDQILLKALEAREHNKQVKTEDKDYHQAVKNQLTDGSYEIKDCFRSAQHNNHLVLKGNMPVGSKDIHNHLNNQLIALAVREVFQLQANYDNGLTPEQYLKQWFTLQLQTKLEQGQGFKWGLKLAEQDLVMLEKLCLHISAHEYANWPTQAQLMAMFQADGYVAQRMSTYPTVLKYMLVGNGSEQEVRNGLLFWEQKLNIANLTARQVNPDGWVAGHGSALKEEQLHAITSAMQEFGVGFKHRAMSLTGPVFSANGQYCQAAMFSIVKSQHKRQQAVNATYENWHIKEQETVSDEQQVAP